MLRSVGTPWSACQSTREGRRFLRTRREEARNQTFVFTTRRVTEKQVTAQGVTFLLHNVKAKRLFGLKTLWRGSAKVAISDPARTLVDMFAVP